MFVIRKAQLEVMRDAVVVAGFEARMLAHVERFFPAAASRLGSVGIRALVSLARERARGHGVSTTGAVTNYLNLMLTFGRDFERDPSLPWVREALAAPGSPSLRLDRLYRLAVRREEQGRGLGAREIRELRADGGPVGDVGGP